MYGSFYAKQLVAETEATLAKDELARAEQARLNAQAARERLVPLAERLRRLLASVPPEVQAAGLSIMDLQVQLRARGRGHSRCHIGELGNAMRKLGFTRERRWGHGGGAAGFQAVWRKNS